MDTVITIDDFFFRSVDKFSVPRFSLVPTNQPRNPTQENNLHKRDIQLPEKDKNTEEN